MSRLILIGPRGSGKTTIAALLAGRLGWVSIDADDALEQRAGMTIHEIFDSEGLAGFRAREMQVLEELLSVDGAVIATGGGAVLHPDNREKIGRSGAVVWLTADAVTLWKRTTSDASSAQRRPALAGGGLEEVAQILTQREPLYRECAHVSVDTADRSPAEVAEQVIQTLAERLAITRDPASPLEQ